MKFKSLFYLLTFVLFGCGNTVSTELISRDGLKIDLTKQNTVLMWLAPDCPLCQTYSSEFLALDSLYRSHFQFVGVLPGNLYSTDEIDHFVDSFHFDLPIVMDDKYLLTKKYQVSVTPEFILLDTNLKIQYQGKFDDWATGLAQKKVKPTQFYLKNALNQFAASQNVSPNYVEPVGCLIEVD